MNIDLDSAEKYRWTFASMSIGYFFLAWFWIARGIRPTVFFGSVWIFMGLMTASAATYLITRRATRSSAREEVVEELRPVLTFERAPLTPRLHHTTSTRTKVHS